jgi:hypothetical protein
MNSRGSRGNQEEVMKRLTVSTNVNSRIGIVPTSEQIKEEINRAWNDHTGFMLWGDMEDLLVAALKLKIDADEKEGLCKEIIDAITKRGHFCREEYPEKYEDSRALR